MVYYDGAKVDEDDESVDLSGENYDYPKLRGVISFDQNYNEILIDAAVNEVAVALAGLKGGRVEAYEVDDSELRASQIYFPIFRLKGVPWTYLQYRSNGAGLSLSLLGSDPLGPEILLDLSARLGVRVIYFGVSDTAAAVSYSLHDRGVLRESFNSVDCEAYSFESLDRTLVLEGIDPEDLSEKFLVDHDALFAAEGFGSYGSDRLKPDELPPRFESARFVIVP